MKLFEESLRYEYPLTKDSIVWDCGGFEGNFAAEITRKYGCRVIIFEPFPNNFHKIAKRFSENKDILVMPVAIGATDEDVVTLWERGDSSGAYAGVGGFACDCVQLSVVKLSNKVDEDIDLIKLNIEGMEYEVLRAMIDNSIVTKFRHIQVQWHFVFPGAEEKMVSIKQELLKTHDLSYGGAANWEGYTIKP